MDCTSKKICYRLKEEAEEALLQARAQFHRSQQAGPISVYQCTECGNWHLTSKGKKSNFLEDTTVNKKINQEREARYWESKFRR